MHVRAINKGVIIDSDKLILLIARINFIFVVFLSVIGILSELRLKLLSITDLYLLNTGLLIYSYHVMNIEKRINN